jgi:hypothetical protein
MGFRYGIGTERPRMNPKTAEIRNKTIAMKKMIFAISTETIATPPKPSTPAIRATMRKVRAQPSVVNSSLAMIGTERRVETVFVRQQHHLRQKVPIGRRRY